MASLDPIGIPPIPNQTQSLELNSRPFKFLASSLPIADRDVLAGLSNHDVRAWAAAKADEYHRFALALLSIYNAVAPIHRLPFEVLSTIFEMCWKDRKSLGIGHVCRQWRSILLNTSRFWASAVKGEQFCEGDCATGYLGAMLERSLPQVLAPSFQHFSERVSPYLALHADKIASLTVSLGSHTELVDLWSCLNAGMRSLETLSISTIDGRSWALGPQNQDEDLHLLPTSLPRLARVSAPGSFLHRFAIPSLRHIDLKVAEPQHLDSVHPLESDGYLRNALAICAPNLESLALRNVSPPGGYDSTAPLSLPALRKLLIHDYPSQCALMLSRLTLPDTTHIHVFIDAGASLCAAVPPSAPAIHAALAATDSVGILRIANTTTVHCSAGETQLLTISLTEPRARGQGGGGGGDGLPRDDLLRFFGGPDKPGAPVGVIAIGDLDSRDVEAVDLRAFPSLLGIITGESIGHHILRELARTDGPDNDDDEGGRTAICPELDMLSLEFKFDFVRLLQEPGDSGGGADSLPAPAPAHGAADDDDVEERRRSLCAELERVLSQRARMGTRLSRLALGGSQEQELRLGSPGDQLRTAKTTSPELGRRPWGSGPIVERIKKLVDGPVRFYG